MLILFDHSTPAPLAPYLIGHAVTKAKDRGWDRLTNGDLLAEAERAGFDLFFSAVWKMQDPFDAKLPKAVEKQFFDWVGMPQKSRGKER